MIKTKADLQDYIRKDLAANSIANWSFLTSVRNPIMKWQISLRKMEYHTNNSNSKFSKAVLKIRQFNFRRKSMKLGFTIPVNVFGPGLSIPHWGTIIVNPKAKVGENCRIHAGTCIGGFDGGAPVIGNDCYIGPGAKLFGAIKIGDKVSIGANAVVNKDFGNFVNLLGVPAKSFEKKISKDMV